MNPIPVSTKSIASPTSGGGGSLSYLVFCALASALGGLLFGYDLFVISGAKDLIVARFGLSSLMEGWFVSSAMVGAMAGCALAVAIVIVAVIALQFLEHRHFSQPPSVWPAPADAKR